MKSNLFNKVNISNLEKALSILYSTKDYTVNVRLKKKDNTKKVIDTAPTNAYQ